MNEIFKRLDEMEAREKAIKDAKDNNGQCLRTKARHCVEKAIDQRNTKIKPQLDDMNRCLSMEGISILICATKNVADTANEEGPILQELGACAMKAGCLPPNTIPFENILENEN